MVKGILVSGGGHRQMGTKIWICNLHIVVWSLSFDLAIIIKKRFNLEVRLSILKAWSGSGVILSMVLV